MIKFAMYQLGYGRRGFVDSMFSRAVPLGAVGRLVWIINLCMRILLGFPLSWQEGCEEALGVSTLWEQSSL